MEKKKRRKTNYVNNQDFLEALERYKLECAKAVELGKPEPRMPNYIGECFLKIATNLCRHRNFIKFPAIHDMMVSDGIENCLSYCRNFDTSVTSNPFSYFTTIISNAFIRRIQSEEKRYYNKCKNIQNHMMNIDYEDINIEQMDTYHNILEFIDAYEKKQQIRKEKKKAKAANTLTRHFYSNSETTQAETDLHDLIEDLNYEIVIDESEVELFDAPVFSAPFECDSYEYEY